MRLSDEQSWFVSGVRTTLGMPGVKLSNTKRKNQKNNRVLTVDNGGPMDDVISYLSNGPFMPHGQCYLWRPDMVVLHAGSDALIALAYFTIPIGLAQLWRKRDDLAFGWMFKLFAAFILACGVTHLFGIWNIWNSNYYTEGILKFITAGISVLTAVMIWPLLPRLLAVPSPTALAERNDALKQEMVRRRSAEQELRELSASLEQTVADRTEELRQAKQALEEQIQASEQVKQRLESIFESAPNGMIVVNREGTILQANGTAHNIFRYAPGELSGQPVERLVPKKRRSQHQGNREHYIAAPVKRMMGERRDLYALCADGGTVPVEIGLNPIKNCDMGEVVASVVDISDRKRYERRIKEHTNALERSNRELKEFAFIASHDLREPLRKIISFTKLLLSKEYGEFNNDGETFAEYVVDAAERMRELLDSLLSYSRVTSRQVEFTATDLNAIVDEVTADLQLAIEEQQARIDVSPLDTIAVDPSQMRQLLQNLVSNSLKYQRPDKTPTIHIRGESAKGNRYRILFEDNGVGFDNQYAEQVFEVFKRLHNREHYPGTGMGLAICRKIVDRHRGEIHARSEPGQGTRFTIELPRDPDQEVRHDH